VINDVRTIDYYYTKAKEDYLLFSLTIYSEKKWESIKDTKISQDKKRVGSINGNAIILTIAKDKPNFSEKELIDYNKLKKEVENIASGLFLTGEYRYRTINIYFSQGNNTDCSQVASLQRVLDHRGDYERGALLELMSGPTSEEKTEGYNSFFSNETANDLKGFKIIKGVAYINFKDFRQKIPNASTSCGGQQFLAQIENTLKQFPGVDKIIMAIDGQPNTFYEWLQFGCPDKTDCSEVKFQTIN